MNRTIIHVDMDAFYAAVETRDNPSLQGKPLIIGGLPTEQRGVVATCNYEARKYGLHSAMSIKEAYRRCPKGIFMRPNIPKYKVVSDALHKIWCDYTNIVEFLSLDEGYLDISEAINIFGSARAIAYQIKLRTKNEIGLTCSIGVGYSMASAKLASEEKKPNGYFEIPDSEFFKNLIIDRETRVIFGVGSKSAEKLKELDILNVRDILNNQQKVISMFGKRGQQIVDMAQGIDTREIRPYYESEMKSIAREQTFQEDTMDYNYIKSFLIMFSRELSGKLSELNLYAKTVTLKITFADMKSITRSKSSQAINTADEIYNRTLSMLELVEQKPIRLVGISLSNFTNERYRQLSFFSNIFGEK